MYYDSDNSNLIAMVLCETDPMDIASSSLCHERYEQTAMKALELLSGSTGIEEALHSAITDVFRVNSDSKLDLSLTLAKLTPELFIMGPQDRFRHEQDNLDDTAHPYGHMTEFLCVFSNQGPIEATVKFQNHSAWVASRNLYPSEITSLIDPKTGRFVTEMRFDDCPAKVKKIEIRTSTNKLVIHAVMPEG